MICHAIRLGAKILGLATLWLMSGFIAETSASQVVIDFENYNLNGQAFLDVGPSLNINNAGGSGVNVTFQGGSNDLRIYDLFQFGGDPNTRGQALIDFPFPAGSNPNGTKILFSAPVSNFSLQAGDFGGDDDTPLTITAFDASGAIVGSDSQPWPSGQVPPFVKLGVSGSGIRSVVYHSGGSFQNSTFIDNVTFTTPVPEPGQSRLISLKTR